MNKRVAINIDKNKLKWENIIPNQILEVIKIYLNQNTKDNIQLVACEACKVPPNCEDQNI